jgi:hypothetical protein
MEARSRLSRTRRQHMLALQAAITAGVPNDELAHDWHASFYAGQQLLELLADPTQPAPMRMVVA